MNDETMKVYLQFWICQLNKEILKEQVRVKMGLEYKSTTRLMIIERKSFI